MEKHKASCDTSTDLPDIPQRALCELTVADRLAIYDHVIQEASQQSAKRESNNKDLYVMWEVIDIHSGELGRIWQEVKDEEFKASQQPCHRGASEKARSASVESRESRVSSRDKHGHKRHRKHSQSRSRERKNMCRRDSHSPDVERYHKKKKKKKKS
ncbi:SR-related and CTD-associated factor 8-like [Carassius carassius]|uniref:SR-related and CTD-associated factor 8-like n=1 Tax=Carassius carassius TaxID=217509 RepID=UPI0028695F88|nr:SR-related and CTD-associated factor 8-like [Carassius carassius]